jgi:hypothetical protein
MFRPLEPRSVRRGNTLIVVLSCISLLAVVGLTAVYLAKDQAERARIQGEPGVDVAFTDNGMGAFNFYLATLIYDAPDNGQGLLNAARGHSLMATMYGRYSNLGGVWQQGGGTIPWNGVGIFGVTDETVAMPGEPQFPRADVVNHRVFATGSNIYDPEFAQQRAFGAATNPAAYIPKNAAYTYPDLNNFFLASQCSATGEVLVPSYYRPNTPGAFGTLDPGNPNWRTRSGVLQSVRPTQHLHPQFPTVPANADGSYTGDVANIPGAFYFNSATGQYVAHNDSIWVDIGLPSFTLPSGKRVKALVAPLVLDLNSRLNLSVHGNRLNGGLAAGIHTSGAGFGAWEVSLERAFGVTNQAEARNIVTNRWGGSTMSGVTAKAFAPRLAPSNQIPAYSAVAWTGNAGANIASLALPGQTGALANSMFSNNPVFGPTFTPSTPGYDSTNTQVANHPALLNPNEFSSFPLSDTKLLSARYGPPPFYLSTFSPTLANSAPNTLRGTSVFTAGAAFNTPNSYRLDPADLNRMLYTTTGYDLDRIGLAPPSGQTQATFAALGGIDLNRKLADYRANTAQPLSPGNMATAVAYGSGTALQADIDRQLLARDIFARMIVAMAAPGASVNPTTGQVTITELPGTPNYNNLRRLAQFAVNIVDYIDDDDISTTFIWNPANPADPFAVANFTTPTNTIVYGTEKPRIVLNEAYAEIVNDPTDQAFTNNAVGASKPAQVRFWLELQNPTSPPYATAGTSPLGTGAVKVRYTAGTDGVTFSPYTVQIVRNIPGGVATGYNSVSSTLRNPGDPNYPANVAGSIAPGGAGPPPDLIFDFSAADGTPGVYALNPAQTTPQTGTPNAAGSILVCAANVPSVTSQAIEFNPAGFGGFANLITATPAGTPGSLTYTIALGTAFPQANTAPSTDVLQHVIVLQRLANPYLPPGATNPYITVDLMDSVPAADRVLLPNTVKTANIRTAKTAAGGAGLAGSKGYDPNTPPAAGSPDLRPRSLGKIQPYTSFSPMNGGFTQPAAAYQSAAGNSGTYNFTFPSSLVLPQNPSVDPGQGVLHTFTRHNGTTAGGPAAQTYVPGVPAALNGTGVTETLMTPFDWLVHLDRPLINQLEVLHATVEKPYLFTQQSVAPNPTGTDVARFSNSIWQNVMLSPTFSPLYQVLDMARIQPYGHMTALGGRIPGKININTITDKRVWDALFDAQGGLNGFTQAQVDQLWNGMMASRTQSMQQRFNTSGTQLTDAAGVAYNTPVAGASVYDNGTATGDRPFLPFGVSTIPPGGSVITVNGITYHVNAGGTNFPTDTLLRVNTGTGLPWLFQTTAINPPQTLTSTPHPYQQLEAARKILNNTTTVSHNFAVFVTVGYFEVTNEAASGIPGGGTFVQLGKEYYLNAPGDTRYKFFAIVDRSMIGLDPFQYKTNTVAHAQVQPFFTTVSTYIAGTSPSTPAGSMTINVAASTGTTGGPAQVYSNGQPVDLMSGLPAGTATLVIGTGATQEIVTVAGVSYNGTGVASVTLSTALQFNHGPGESVSNILPGNPGPQTTFDVTQAPYNYVVPFWSKLQ